MTRRPLWTLFVALQFIGTETAVTPLGKPTIRYHKYTLVHNPKMSTTKAMEIDIKLAAAIKNNRQIIKHIASISEKVIIPLFFISQVFLITEVKARGKDLHLSQLIPPEEL